jgi:hypothetical protein
LAGIQREQFLDLLEGEPGRLGRSDELQAAHVLLAIASDARAHAVA